MTISEKSSVVLEPELIEKVEKCCMYFECSSKEVIKLAVEELWNRREEIYRNKQTLIHKNQMLEKQTRLF